MASIPLPAIFDGLSYSTYLYRPLSVLLLGRQGNSREGGDHLPPPDKPRVKTEALFDQSVERVIEVSKLSFKLKSCKNVKMREVELYILLTFE